MLRPHALFLSAAILLGGCATQPAATTRTPTPKRGIAHTRHATLDWVGTYAGVLPCADCPGVREVITLNKDHAYEITTQYVGRGDQLFRRGNVFSWIDGNTIRLEGVGAGPKLYRVGANRLTQLGRDGQVITGPLAARFILKKIAKTRRKRG
ncbi:copper resistance protein NlpE [Acidithiobacillus sp.]|uniref:copper resistance protein NlpE n=1 Tax=Acidithiobacillus sp. TaxID=1872118 RepID=UPI0026315E97|nr:copper resistance protein NlpE [Acidithiobacillus sp.]